jgi:hypothetical protein
MTTTCAFHLPKSLLPIQKTGQRTPMGILIEKMITKNLFHCGEFTTSYQILNADRQEIHLTGAGFPGLAPKSQNRPLRSFAPSPAPGFLDEEDRYDG